MPTMAGVSFAGQADTTVPVELVKAETSGSHAVQLTWTKVQGATKYVVYGTRCGKKFIKLATVKGEKSYTVKKTRGKKLLAHSSYKFYVVAHTANGTFKSKNIHFITGKTKGKYANAKSIAVQPTSKTVKPGKTTTLKVTTKIYKNKKHINKSHGAATRFVSDNPTVASVNAKGIVTAKNEGKATIYVQDIGGLWCKTVITVKLTRFNVSFDANGHGTAPGTITVVKGQKVTAPNDPTEEGYTFGGWYKEAACTNAWDFDNDTVNEDITLYAKWDAAGCLAPGTMITMANGKRQAVETLEVGDRIKTFDHETGEISADPIYAAWAVEECHGNFTLHFDDGITVSVVQEHCFFDRDTNRYEVISYQNASEYVGHCFYNADENKWEELLSVEFSEEPVTAYYIFTSKHYNHFAEGMLSLDPLDDGLITYVFEFGENLKFDEVKMVADIEKYGLMTLNEMPYVPKEYFDALNMQYLKIAYGKGLTDKQTVEEKIHYYLDENN